MRGEPSDAIFECLAHRIVTRISPDSKHAITDTTVLRRDTQIGELTTHSLVLLLQADGETWDGLEHPLQNLIGDDVFGFWALK